MDNPSRRDFLRVLLPGIAGTVATMSLNSGSMWNFYASLEQRTRVDIQGDLTRSDLQTLEQKTNKVARLDKIDVLTRNLEQIVYKPRSNMFRVGGRLVEKNSLFDFNTEDKPTYRIVGEAHREQKAITLYKGSTDKTLAHEIAHIHHLTHPDEESLDQAWTYVTELYDVKAKPNETYRQWQDNSFLQQDGFITPYAAKGYHEETSSFPTEDIATLFTDVYQTALGEKNRALLPRDERLLEKVGLLRDFDFISTKELELVESRYKKR